MKPIFTIITAAVLLAFTGCMDDAVIHQNPKGAAVTTQQACTKALLCRLDEQVPTSLVCNEFDGTEWDGEGTGPACTSKFKAFVPCSVPWRPKVTNAARWYKEWGPLTDYICDSPYSQIAPKPPAREPPPAPSYTDTGSHPMPSDIVNVPPGTMLNTPDCSLVESQCGNDNMFQWVKQVPGKCMVSYPDVGGNKWCYCIDVQSGKQISKESWLQQSCNDGSMFTKDICVPNAKDPINGCTWEMQSPETLTKQFEHVYCVLVAPNVKNVTACLGHENMTDCQQSGYEPLLRVKAYDATQTLPALEAWCGELNKDTQFTHIRLHGEKDGGWYYVPGSNPDAGTHIKFMHSMYAGSYKFTDMWTCGGPSLPGVPNYVNDACVDKTDGGIVVRWRKPVQ